MTTKEQGTALSQLGLDARQQATYLALLELGSGSVAAIAQHADLERTGLYGVLRSLQELGLVAEQTVGKKQQWLAHDPKRLDELVKERQQSIQNVLPELQALWKATDARPRVRYYEGVEGMRTILDDTLKSSSKELLGILSAADLFDTVGQRWMDGYTKQRIQKKLVLRVVRSQQKEVGEQWLTSTKERRELRYTPATMLFSMTMYVYDNKVALLSTRQENFGMIIESDEFATQQRYLFEALWQISKPVPAL